jgi:hypothetical protein
MILDLSSRTVASVMVWCMQKQRSIKIQELLRAELIWRYILVHGLGISNVMQRRLKRFLLDLPQVIPWPSLNSFAAANY